MSADQRRFEVLELDGRAPLGQISNHAAAQTLIAVQEPLPWGGAWQSAALSASWAWYTPPGPPVAGDFTAHTTEGLGSIERAIHTWDKAASNPTIIAARSSTLSIRRQLTISPYSSTATTQIAYTL